MHPYTWPICVAHTLLSGPGYLTAGPGILGGEVDDLVVLGPDHRLLGQAVLGETGHWVAHMQPWPQPAACHPPRGPYLGPCLVHRRPLRRVVEIEEDVLATLSLHPRDMGFGESPGSWGRPATLRCRGTHLWVLEAKVQSSIVREEAEPCQEHPVLEGPTHMLLSPWNKIPNSRNPPPNFSSLP